MNINIDRETEKTLQFVDKVRQNRYGVQNTANAISILFFEYINVSSLFYFPFYFLFYFLSYFLFYFLRFSIGS